MAKLEKIEKKVQQYFLAEEERLTSQGEESRLKYFRKIKENRQNCWKDLHTIRCLKTGRCAPSSGLARTEFLGIGI